MFFQCCPWNTGILFRIKQQFILMTKDLKELAQNQIRDYPDFPSQAHLLNLFRNDFKYNIWWIPKIMSRWSGNTSMEILYTNYTTKWIGIHSYSLPVERFLYRNYLFRPERYDYKIYSVWGPEITRQLSAFSEHW